MKRLLHALSILFFIAGCLPAFGSEVAKSKALVVLAKLERREAIAAIKMIAAEKALVKQEQRAAQAQSELDNPQSWFASWYSDADRRQTSANENYAFAQEQQKVAELRKTSEGKIQRAQKALMNATALVEKEEAQAENPQLNPKWSLIEKAWRLPSAKSSGLVVGGALVVYALWKSRTWEGWQHLKSLEFKKFGTCVWQPFAKIGNQVLDLGKKIGLVTEQPVAVNTQSAQQPKNKKPALSNKKKKMVKKKPSTKSTK